MFEENQIVMYCPRHSDPIPVRIRKITPKGIIRVQYMDGSVIGTGFKVAGWGENNNAYPIGDTRFGGHLELLGKDETAESVIADNVARAQAKQQESAEKRAAFEKDVTDWWKATGEAFWASRLAAGVLGDVQIDSIRFTDKWGEERVCLVTVQENVDSFLRGRRFELQCSGISKRKGQNSSVGSFSMGTITGNSLEECLYSLTH